ncbi:MAG: glycosyltransferase family 2 protein [Pirellulaceae bacterium]|jgi:dolichol-phosphate mannosyltransferase|nr:glycosyltransferase family 2 protein [Pirellulaceae bacterium]MDP7019660.1 glycosyltransferase family 2 protein [Pirellulaceae bacterium]
MISIVLPIFNEQESLPLLHERLGKVLAEIAEPYEVIVVNDGSTDGTAAQLDALHREDERWKYVSFSRNFGHQTAVTAGLHYSSGEVVVVMDADLQDPPEVVPLLLEKWREGNEVVYAVRRNRQEGWLKRAAYSVFYRLMNRVASIEIPLDAGDFCLMDRRVVDVLNSMPERSRYVRGMRSWVGFRQTGVEYDRPARQAGDAKYTWRELFGLAFDGILSFSHTPLRIASWVGIGLCGVSMLLVALVCAWWASGVHIGGMHPRASVGWTSLMCGMLLLSGLQMLLMGVLGEYLARMFDEVKNRPLWVVSRTCGVQNADRLSQGDCGGGGASMQSIVTSDGFLSDQTTPTS